MLHSPTLFASVVVALVPLLLPLGLVCPGLFVALGVAPLVPLVVVDALLVPLFVPLVAVDALLLRLLLHLVLVLVLVGSLVPLLVVDAQLLRLFACSG